MQKHTEGPFSIGQDCTNLLDKDRRSENGRFIAIDAPGHGALAIVVVRMEDDEADNPRLLGNLALFAGAADLLEALKAFVYPYQLETRATDTERQLAGRAAILKATGGAS